MKRGAERGAGLRAWLVGLILPLVALAGVFSLVPYEAMERDWPLGITQREVAWYQRWFDRRPVEHAIDSTVVLRLDSGAVCLPDIKEGRHSQVISTEGFRGSVDVERTAQGWVFHFPAERPFEGMHAMDLRPADAQAMRMHFSALIAHEVGVPAVTTRLVRLVSCGKDLGAFLAQERVTPGFYRHAGFANVDTGAGTGGAAEARAHAFTSWLANDTTRVDQQHWAAHTLLRSVQGGVGGSDIAFDPSRGGFIVVWRGLGPDGAAGSEVDTVPLPVADANRVRALRAKLREDSAVWNDRFQDIALRWAPALSPGHTIGFTQARLRNASMAYWHDLMEAPLPMASVAPKDSRIAEASIDPWLRPHVIGDSAVFTRGVHELDHMVTLPVGMTLVLEKGTRIFFSPGAGLLVRGAVYMNGTGPNPVFLRPADDGVAYGVIAVHGDGRTPVRLRGVRMSGGGAAWMGDRYNAGMLTFHDCAVQLEGCALGPTSSGAIVSVARGTLRAEGNSLVSNMGDGITVEMAKAEVLDCAFTGSGDSSGTKFTGLRVIGGTTALSGCTISGISGTGASFGGQGLALVQNNVFTQERIGLEVKDGAQVHVAACRFEGNGVAYQALGERKVDAGGRLTVGSNTLLGNGRDSWTDGVGSIVPQTLPPTPIAALRPQRP